MIRPYRVRGSFEAFALSENAGDALRAFDRLRPGCERLYDLSVEVADVPLGALAQRCPVLAGVHRGDLGSRDGWTVAQWVAATPGDLAREVEWLRGEAQRLHTQSTSLASLSDAALARANELVALVQRATSPEDRPEVPPSEANLTAAYLDERRAAGLPDPDGAP